MITQPILTAEQVYTRPTTASHRVAEWVVIECWPRNVIPFFLPEGIAPGVHTNAMVFGGTWVAGCPTCKTIVQATSPQDTRFFCIVCLNAQFGNKWLAVYWPDDYKSIEEPLLLRPNPANRNWLPNETIEELWMENLSHSLPDPRRPELTIKVKDAIDKYNHLEAIYGPGNVTPQHRLELEKA